MAYRIVAKSPDHLNDIVEDIMSWFETARDYRVEFDTESRKFADPATKQIVTKKIDVLHVQDPMTGKKTVIKFIPLLRPEEMKIEMGGENEHVMKGKLKNMMKGRGEFKTYNKDTLRKMSESDATTLLKQLGQELKSHDWNYQYSDDPKYYDRGSREWESIRNIISQINKTGLQTDGEAIWKQFAPSDQKNNYPNKLQESKMKVSEFKNLIREEVKNVLTEAPMPGLKGSISRHFRAYKGEELYQAVEELESTLRDLASGTNKTITLDDIADIIIDIKDAAYDKGFEDGKYESSEF
jgi:hypothetical protein